jgi:hypothetical protein
MTEPYDRQSVLKARSLSRQKRRAASEQMLQTREYLRPQSFVNRWTVKQDAMRQHAIEQGGKAIRKTAPVIAIITAAALLFIGQKSIGTKMKRSTRNPPTIDQ